MEPTGDQLQPNFIELSDQDRIQILDQIVLPEFQKKSRPPLLLETAYNYRHYVIRPMDQQSQQVVDILNKLDSIFRGSYINTALLNIRDHPEVLSTNRKIHLQPQPKDLLKVVEVLAKSIAGEEDLYQLLIFPDQKNNLDTSLPPPAIS